MRLARWAVAVAVVAQVGRTLFHRPWVDWSGPLDGAGLLAHTGPRPGPTQEITR